MKKYQAIIQVGLFGRVVETKPRFFRWLAILEADLHCMCEARVTEYKIIEI